jgi:hypothetical protein
MNIFNVFCSFFFKKTIAEQSVVVKSPIRTPMSPEQARWLIIGEKTDYKKTIN